jgi:hypothetical protein
MVGEFRDQRAKSPRSTGGQLHSVGRGDIDPLHSTDGSRAATWFDEKFGVCWFLAFTPEHDYKLMESRAASQQLLPDEADEVILEVEREELDFELRVRPGVRRLTGEAVAHPRQPMKGTVGAIVRLEVTAVVEAVEDDKIVDLYLSARVPVVEDGDVAPPGWPGGDLLRHLASFATGLPMEELQFDWADEFPHGNSTRKVDLSLEQTIVVRSWVIGD